MLYLDGRRMTMLDAQFMTHIICEICDYARANGMGPNETLETVADNIKALLEISTFDNWVGGVTDA